MNLLGVIMKKSITFLFCLVFSIHSAFAVSGSTAASDQSIEELQREMQELLKEMIPQMAQMEREMDCAKREHARQDRMAAIQKTLRKKKLTRWNNTLLFKPVKFIHSKVEPLSDKQIIRKYEHELFRDVTSVPIKDIPVEPLTEKWIQTIKTKHGDDFLLGRQSYCGSFKLGRVKKLKKKDVSGGGGDASDKEDKTDVSLGIYNKDLLRGGFFLTDFFSDVFFCREIGKARVENTFQQTEKDYKWLLCLLENYAKYTKELGMAKGELDETGNKKEKVSFKQHIKNIKKKLKYGQKDKKDKPEKKEKTTLKQKFQKSKEKRRERKKTKKVKLTEEERLVLKKYLAIKKLKKHVGKTHRVINYNPFKKVLIVPFATRFITQQLLISARENLIHQNWEYTETKTTYVKDKDSGYRPVDKKHGYVTSVFKNPLSAVGNYFAGKLQELFVWMPDFKEELKGYLIPEIYRKQIVKYFVSFLSIYLGGMIFDRFYNDLWIEYLLKNHEEAIKLLKIYEYAKDYETEDSFNQARLDLRKFISGGHKRSAKYSYGIYKKWLLSQNIGDAKTKTWYAGLITFHEVLRLRENFKNKENNK